VSNSTPKRGSIGGFPHGNRRRGAERADRARRRNRQRLVIPSTIPANRNLFEENYGIFLDLVEMTSELDYGYDMIRRR